VQQGVELGELFLAQVLAAAAQQAADLVQRVVLVPAPREAVLLDRRRTSSTTWVPNLTTWNASSTATASGSSSRIALA